MRYIILFIFIFKQKTAYEMRISDWSSDVCSSDLLPGRLAASRVTARTSDFVAHTNMVAVRLFRRALKSSLIFRSVRDETFDQDETRSTSTALSSSRLSA